MPAPTIEGAARHDFEEERESRPGWYWLAVIASIVAAMLLLGTLVQGKVGDLVESAFDLDHSRSVSLGIRYEAHDSSGDAPIVELEPTKVNEEFDAVRPLSSGESTSVELAVTSWSGWENSYGSGLQIHLSDLPLRWIYDSFDCISPIKAQPFGTNTFQLGYVHAAVEHDPIQSDCVVSTREVEPAVLTIRATTATGRPVPVPVSVRINPSASRGRLDPVEIQPGETYTIQINPAYVRISAHSTNGWDTTMTRCGSEDDTFAITLIPTEGEQIDCEIFYEAAE